MTAMLTRHPKGGSAGASAQVERGQAMGLRRQAEIEVSQRAKVLRTVAATFQIPETAGLNL